MTELSAVFASLPQDPVLSTRIGRQPVWLIALTMGP